MVNLPRLSEAYLDPAQKTVMELFVKIVSGFELLTTFTKSFDYRVLNVTLITDQKSLESLPIFGWYRKLFNKLNKLFLRNILMVLPIAKIEVLKLTPRQKVAFLFIYILMVYILIYTLIYTFKI